MGAPRCGHNLCPDVRRHARSLLRPSPAMHPRPHLRIRSRAGIQRRRLLLRSFRRTALSSWATSTRRTCSTTRGLRPSNANSETTSATRLLPSARAVAVRPLCNGGCPKDRFALSRDGDPGQNYLCAGLELFFTHTQPAMKMMGQLVQRNRPCSDVMAMIAAEDAKRGPYVPCPCGSGKKFRFCHGDPAPQSPFTRLSPTVARCTMQELSRCTPNSHAEHRPATRREPLNNSAAVYGAPDVFFLRRKPATLIQIT